VIEPVQANVLDQDIEAMDKAASGRISALSCCGSGGNMILLKLDTA
jgi:hypothetical protein